MFEDVRLVGNPCGAIFSRYDTSKISKISSCEAHSVHYKTLVCRGEYLAQCHTQNGVVCLLFGKSAKCASSGLPQVLSVRAPLKRDRCSSAHPPTHPRTNTHICKCIFRHASVSSNHPCQSVRWSVGHTFGFPFCQCLWSPHVKSLRKQTQIIFQFWVWVGFFQKCIF